MKEDETGMDKPIGTPKAGYAKGDQGPFRCDMCIHFKGTKNDNACDHPDVLEDAKAGKIPIMQGKPIVDPSGCCNYFRPPAPSPFDTFASPPTGPKF